MNLKRMAYANFHDMGQSFVDYVLLNDFECVFSGVTTDGASTINAAERIITTISRAEKGTSPIFFDLQTHLGYAHYKEGEYDFNKLIITSQRNQQVVKWQPEPCPKRVLAIFKDNIGVNPRRKKNQEENRRNLKADDDLARFLSDWHLLAVNYQRGIMGYMKTAFSLRRKLDSLRKKYPRFVYQKYFYRVKRGDLKITFYFKIEPDIVLKPRIIIKNMPEMRLEKIGKRVMNNLVFHLGMMEIPSYWKTTCSPEIAVQAGYLDKNQIAWWHELIIKGMGQYFYKNKIDWRDQDFLKISVNLGVAAPALEATSLELKDRYLVPLAGGKDSLVTLEALRKRGESINCFLLNPTKIIKKVVKIAGIKNPVIVERRIDPTLLDLNKQGYLNGHTPFTALLSFTSVLCATLFDYQHIAFSNEKSADEGNISYLGKNINHQWAKTSEFEKKFRVYCQKYLVKGVNYFSYLRKYTELQIAKMFSHYHKYFAVFSSCNAGMKIGNRTKDRWCGQCPKCLFTYLILYPFLTKKDLHKIFGQDLFENKKLLPVLKNMVGQGAHKPFECVGTYKESKTALRLSLAKAKREGKLPYLLEKYNEIK